MAAKLLPFAVGIAVIIIDRTSITVRNLATSASTIILQSADAAQFGEMGRARFSPDGQRVASALTKGSARDVDWGAGGLR